MSVIAPITHEAFCAAVRAMMARSLPDSAPPVLVDIRREVMSALILLTNVGTVLVDNRRPAGRASDGVPITRLNVPEQYRDALSALMAGDMHGLAAEFRRGRESGLWETDVAAALRALRDFVREVDEFRAARMTDTHDEPLVGGVATSTIGQAGAGVESAPVTERHE